MISRFLKMKKTAVATGVALVGAVAYAAPLVLDWRFIGTGAVDPTSTCHTVFDSGCTANSTGTGLGQHIGSGTYNISLVSGNTAKPTNSSGGKCLATNGLSTGGVTNSITAANGDIVNFNTVGVLCEEAGSGSSYHYNGTYRIIGGTGRFSSVVGGGNLTATFQKGGTLGVVNAVYMKVDGTINF